MIFKSKNTTNITKHGVKMHIYNTKEECPEAAVVQPFFLEKSLTKKYPRSKIKNFVAAEKVNNLGS